MDKILEFVLNEVKPIENLQTVIETMQKIENDYSIIVKFEEQLNNRQGDLLHILELDLDKKEYEDVCDALREIRFIRRDVKNIIINLTEAKTFVGKNYRFISECTEIIKKMKKTNESMAARKYYLRNYESISSILNMEKHSKSIDIYAPLESRHSKET